MDLNRENLNTIFRGLKSTFVGAFKHGEDESADALATTIQSGTASERFDWMGDMPEMREWLGARVMHQLRSFNYEVFPKEWEVTFRVQAKDVEDDRIGIYKLQAAQGGEAARLLKVREIAKALEDGISGICYDGQPFFDTEHPVGQDGDITLTSNFLNGGGASTASPWYLLDSTRVVKPIIVVERKKPRFQSFQNMEDEYVFLHKEFLFGVDARLGTGYGLWQTCLRNEGELNVDNLQASKLAMQLFASDTKNEYGRRKRLGIRPDTLVVGVTNEEKARAILESRTVVDRTEALAVGTSDTANPVYKGFKLQVVSWLP